MDNIAGQASDDIFALFSRFDLDTSQYKIFERQTPGQEITPEAEVPVFTTVATMEPEPEPKPTPLRREPRMEHTPARRPVQVPERRQNTNIQEACIQVFGAAGGVGVTTVVATLARFFSRQGFSCGVYGGAKESILPLHFGFQRLSSSHNRFLGLRSLYEPGVHLLRPGSLSTNPDCAGLTETELLELGSTDCGHTLERLVCDRSTEIAAHQGTRLYVAVPDVGSVFGIQKFLQQHGHGDRLEKSICVLNRFDPESALHVEVHSWFTQQFTTVCTIRDSRLVPEALAESSTVLDWCPEANVTADFEKLGQATSTLTTARSSRKQEGVVLCS